MDGLLVLWDVDYTLVSADGLGTWLYEEVFRELFGRELPAVAPKAGRTDRAIILDTLALAGIPDPPAHADRFLTALAAHVRLLTMPAPSRTAASRRFPVRALPGAAQTLAAVAALATSGSQRQPARPGPSVPPGPSGAPVLCQSVLTGNIRPLAALKLGAAGLTDHLDLDAGAYGDAHEVRAELVHVARRAAAAAYGADFGGRRTVLVGDTPLDVAAALATGARAVAVATGSYPAADLAASGAETVLPDLTDLPRVLAAVMSFPA